MMAKNKLINLRMVLFAVSIVITGLMLYPPLRSVIGDRVLRSDYYDHILVIPFMSAMLFFMRRKQIFADARYMAVPGIPVAAGGMILYLVGLANVLPLNSDNRASWMVFSALAAFIGFFLFLFGTRSFRSARFLLLFLAFMIPVPKVILDGFIRALLIGSTEAVDFIFSFIDITYVRDGYFFYFHNVAIEVARQCSGIRSSLALVVTGVLAGHLFLDRFWKQGILVLSIFPITVFKNGIRIVTLTLLAIHVDIRFLTGSFLHHSGGFIFYIPALVFMGLEIWVLRRWPRRQEVHQ